MSRKQFFKQILLRKFSNGCCSYNWKKTLCLPRSPLNIHRVVGKQFDSQYTVITNKWNEIFKNQLSDTTKDIFWLHDGPPYANGKLHAGHMLNKLLKDIIVRHQIMNDTSVLFRPGWDCHGLPIELNVQRKANVKSMASVDPLFIRSKCRSAALNAVSVQKNELASWGVLSDFERPYLTINFDYELAELELFVKLVKKGLVFRKRQPVYWSPTSGTALAESELEYNPVHKSLSAFVAFKLQSSFDNKERFIATWTTTLWSLPANEAVAFSPNLEYAWYSDKNKSSKQYLMSKSCVDRLSKALGYEMQLSSDQFSMTEFSSLRYIHPFNHKKICPIIPSNHVTSDLGTGLVHVAPVHGHDDWMLGVKNKLEARSVIDDCGNFSEEVPDDRLVGKNALNESDGIAAVLNILRDNNESGVHSIAVEPIVHSYPYDWRTKAPVMIRASKQWFINLLPIRDTAVKVLDSVQIQPKNLRNEFIQMLTTRDHWCISRQRVWGVPIPVFFRNSEQEVPILEAKVLDDVIESFKRYGTVESWWSEAAENLISPEIASEFNINFKSLTRGRDILDVWFDSGVSWYASEKRCDAVPNMADCYVEGVDQFRGWFLSSLLLSVAANDKSPYKRILWHGFVVDDFGKKMSKSVGNVIAPSECIKGSVKRKLPATGLDGIRIWAAKSQNESLVKLGTSTLDECRQLLLRIRNSFSFIIGNLSQAQLTGLGEMAFVDKYILLRLDENVKKIQSCYDSFNFRRAINVIDRFFTAELSQFYFTTVKDRLYCDEYESARRMSALKTLDVIGKNMACILAPITPFTADEVSEFLFHKTDSLLSKKYSSLERTGKMKSDAIDIVNIVEFLLNIREKWLQTESPTDSTDYEIDISFHNESLFLNHFRAVVANDGNGMDIEEIASEVLHVSKCRFVPWDCNFMTMDTIFLGKTLKISMDWKKITNKCPRCRRFNTDNSKQLCKRCEKVVAKLS